MAATEQDAAEALEGFVKRFINLETVLCTIVSVNASALTCVVQCTANDSEIPNVRLSCTINSVTTGIYVLPKVGANAIVTLVEGDKAQGYLLACDDFTQLFIQSSNGFQMVVESSGVINFNGGNNGGLINIEALVTRLNNLENAWNTFCENYVPGSPSTVGLPATLADAVIEPITDRSDFEDTNVNH